MREDPHQSEVAEKVKRLVNGPPFDGDFDLAFKHYADADNGESMTDDGVMRILEDAGVTGYLVRKMWTLGIFRKADSNKNRKLSKAELKAAFGGEHTGEEDGH